MKHAVLLLLLIAVSPFALACSCGPTPPPKDAFKEAQAVFAGRCIAGKLVKRRMGDAGDFPACQFTFEVTRTWKGTADKKEITVLTGLGWGDCGYGFQIGASYILYCYDTGDGQLQTNICTRTCITDFEPRADDEMKQLDDAAGTATK